MKVSIETARKRVAQDMRELAHAIHAEDAYADHVTAEDKAAYLQKRLEQADDIESGEYDGNFTIWQRMREYTHGDCPAFLP